MSITKGCFVHKKKDGKKKKNKTRNRNLDEVFNREQYEKVWKVIEKEIKEIERDAYRATVDSIVNFIHGYHKSSSLGIKEIPTAVLVMGVNMPDHSTIFQLLEQEINRSKIPSTVVLQSKDCSNLSSMLQKTIWGLMDKYQKEMNLDQIHLKRLDCTFAKLLSWYKNIAETQAMAASPAKKSKKRQKTQDTDVTGKPMVILIKDVEGFSREVLKEFILCCNLYVNELPIVLVFGVASAMVTLHSLLPQKALSCLGIETFYSLTATEYLTKILQKVVMSADQPFKLGPRTFKLLVDTVLYHDFSVTNLTRMLKFSLMEHFYCNEVSELCCNVSDVEEKVEELSTEQLEILREIPSVKNFTQNNPESNLASTQDSEFRAAIVEHLKKLHSYHKFMISFLSCLHALVHDLPGYPFGKQLREVYMVALEDQVTETPNYSQAEKLLRMHSKDEMKKKMEFVLGNVRDTIVTEFDGPVYDMEEKIQSFIYALDHLNTDNSEKESSGCPPVFGSEKINRFELQEKLRSRIKAQRRSKYENCRQSIVDYFRSIFKDLVPPSKMLFHELLYFNDASSLKIHLMAAPRSTAHRALVNPHQYFKCRCCKISDSGQVLPSMPDLSILYKLHSEYGRLINLRDWLEAFKAIKIEEVEKMKKWRTEKDESASELEVRFVQAVSELEMLGFIKSTKRKTDHVARLTFGKL